MAERLARKVAPPALPVPTSGPLKGYLDALNNILRLFFNLVTSTVNTVFGQHGGRFLDNPNALYYSTAAQAIAVADTGQVVTFNNTYLQSGFTIDAGTSSQITATYSGVYNFQFSAQPTSSSASSKTVYMWISRSGTDLGNTGKQFVLVGSSDVKNMTFNFNLDLQAGQYVALKWSSSSTNTSLSAQVAASPHPGIPSAVVAINFVSALPETLPTPP